MRVSVAVSLAFGLASFALVVACSSSGGGAVTPVDAGVDAGGAPSTCTAVLPKTCPSPAPSWATDVQPIVASRCWSCHADGGVEATENDLGSYAKIYEARATVLGQVNGCHMPPAGNPQPTEAERETLLGWFVCGSPDN